MTERPDVPAVPLREAAALLGLTPEAARSALQRAGVSSGYPREQVEWLRDNRPGRGKGGGRPRKEKIVNISTSATGWTRPSRAPAATCGSTRTET